MHKLLSQMRLMIRVFVFFALSIFCAACSTNPSYMGIDISRASHSAVNCGDLQECYESLDLGSLARLAKAGNKRAQFELGLRFENGVGVPKDLSVARALYWEAANDTQLRQTAFASDGDAVRAETSYIGVDEGLREAKERLSLLSFNSMDVVGELLLENDAIRDLSEKTAGNLTHVSRRYETVLVEELGSVNSFGYFIVDRPAIQATGICGRVSTIMEAFGGELEKCFQQTMRVITLSDRDSLDVSAVDYVHSGIDIWCEPHQGCLTSPFAIRGLGYGPLEQGSCGLVAINTFRSQNSAELHLLRGLFEGEINTLPESQKTILLKRRKLCN